MITTPPPPGHTIDEYADQVSVVVSFCDGDPLTTDWTPIPRVNFCKTADTNEALIIDRYKGQIFLGIRIR